MYIVVVGGRHRRYRNSHNKLMQHRLSDNWSDPICNDLIVGGRRFNLTSLARPDRLPYLFFGDDQEYVYLANICRPLPFWQCGGEQGAFVCQYVAAGYNFVKTVAHWQPPPTRSLSKPTFLWTLIEQEGLRLVTANGNHCNKSDSLAKATINFICDREAKHPVFTVEADECEKGYSFSVQTQCACAHPHGCLRDVITTNGKALSPYNPWPSPTYPWPSIDPWPNPSIKSEREKGIKGPDPQAQTSAGWGGVNGWGGGEAGALLVFVLLASTFGCIAMMISLGCHRQSPPRVIDDDDVGDVIGAYGCPQRCRCRRPRRSCLCWRICPCFHKDYIYGTSSISTPSETGFLFDLHQRSPFKPRVGPVLTSEDDFWVDYGTHNHNPDHGAL